MSAGLIIGLAGSLAVATSESGAGPGFPNRPVTLIAACAVLIAVAALGCWLPARRAMRVDPAYALRHD